MLQSRHQVAPPSLQKNVLAISQSKRFDFWHSCSLQLRQKNIAVHLHWWHHLHCKKFVFTVWDRKATWYMTHLLTLSEAIKYYSLQLNVSGGATYTTKIYFDSEISKARYLIFGTKAIKGNKMLQSSNNLYRWHHLHYKIFVLTISQSLDIWHSYSTGSEMLRSGHQMAPPPLLV